jgi:hypothetical protein
LPPIDTSFRSRDSLKSEVSLGLGETSPGASPTRAARLGSVDTAYYGANRASPTTPTQTPTLGYSPGHSRQGSATSGVIMGGGQGVMESFDASAWGESIRRSFTTRRPHSDRD